MKGNWTLRVRRREDNTLLNQSILRQCRFTRLRVKQLPIQTGGLKTYPDPNTTTTGRAKVCVSEIHWQVASTRFCIANSLCPVGTILAFTGFHRHLTCRSFAVSLMEVWPQVLFANQLNEELGHVSRKGACYFFTPRKPDGIEPIRHENLYCGLDGQSNSPAAGLQ